ncbi:MAG TPA: hypothetical protein VK539_34965 [Myxococcaceae bacterium]|nr:hypothetical protein [Myxococcaceae bacterium]
MKKLLLVGALALGGVSCAPDIKQDPAPDNIVAQFDPAGSPAVLPLPNDLAINPATGLVAAPIDPNAPAAQQEFTRDYLNTLNGFPTTAAATTKIADLDEASINADTVRFIDLLQGTPIATPSVTVTRTYDAATGTLTIAPPATGWPKGGRYAIALVGGANGLKGKNGKPVIGSAVWAFASSPEPLVTCEDLTAPNCQATTEIIPSTKTDPAEKLADQTASALRLEQLRRAYRPLLDALETQNVSRQDVVLVWTFRIMNMPEATFNPSPDPAAAVIPFPNDLLINPATGKVNLQAPAGASAQLQQLFEGLRTLDGFSTTSAIVSESSNTLGPIDTGSRLDPGSLETGTRFVKLTPGGTAPNMRVCLSCVSSGPVSANNPQQLQFVPNVPLDEKSRYAAIMTTDLKDERGRKVAPSGAFALLRMASPLVVDGKSQVSGVPDATANALEPVRQGFKPMFDALDAAGLKRAQLALAWSFTTQSTISDLAKLHALPSTLYAMNGLPASASYVTDRTGTLLAVMNSSNPQLPTANIGKILQGNLFAPFALTGPAGTLNPAQPRIDRIPFVLTTPNTTMPAAGYPVAVFSHGLTGNHMNGLAIASALASQGYAMISIDNPFHGERSSCVGTAAQLGQSSDDAACADPVTQRCETTLSAATAATYGRCVARDTATANTCDPAPTASPNGDLECSLVSQGRCLPTGKCEGGDFRRASAGGPPVISGANFLNLANLFATRDNFRQHAIDLAQVVRVVNSNEIDAQIAGSSGIATLKLDGTKVVYLGQSLGAILGTLSTSVAPGVGNVVLNVPGGSLTDILLTSNAFATQRTAFLAGLSAQGINPGTAAFDQFIGLAKMILDPADPVNYSYYVENGTVPAGREALIQYITNDEITPNATTLALINAANNRDPSKKKVETSVVNPAGLTERHGFLLNFRDRAVTEAAQNEAVQFLKTGMKP